MARPGPKPKPTAEKLLEGTRKDRINDSEPTPPPGIPDPPEWLDAEARKAWATLAPQLAEAQLLTQLDATALAMLCTAQSQYIDAARKLAKFGPVTKTAAGGFKPSPYLAAAREAGAALSRLLAEFGCTPSSRSRLRPEGPAKPAESELAAFVKSRPTSKPPGE